MPLHSQGAGESMRNSRSRLDRRGAVVAVVSAAMLVLAACGGSGGTSASKALAAAAARADAPAGAIKVGVLTTCGGPFATFEAQSFSGAKYALIKDAGAKASGQNAQDQVTGATVAAKPISISYGCSDATPDKAVAEARRLV